MNINFSLVFGVPTIREGGAQWANLSLQVVELSYNCYFLYILIQQSKNVAAIITEHQIENLFVLTALYGGLLGRHQGQFLAQNSSSFVLHPHNPLF